MMKKIMQWVLAAILICGSSLLTSCSIEDNNSVNPGPEIIPGEFFSSAVNKLIDENYPLVQSQGYGELVIPANYFDKSTIYLPKVHCDVMDIMATAGYKTYVNGGAVRDGILGTPIHDVDFSTDATPEQMVAIVPNSEIVNTGGGLVAQAHHPDGDVTDMVPMHGIDSRLQGKPGMPANGAYGQTYSKNLLDDTYSRDLTINSLYYDYQTGDIIDYHGGLHDLREHIIRTVYDANLMYPINSSALIRTVRFAARYGYDIDAATTQAIADHMHYCDELQPSLLNYYVTKGFTDGCCKRTYQYYLNYGITDRYIKMLDQYARNKSYTDRLFPAFDYLDEQKDVSIGLGIAALFLPCMLDALDTQTPSMEKIVSTWNQLEESSGQKAHFEMDDYSGTKTEVMSIWYLYTQMTNDDVLANDAKKATVINNNYFKQAQTLLGGYAKSDATLQKYVDFWSNATAGQSASANGFFSKEVNELIDLNYLQVLDKGYAELRIPKTMYDNSVFTFPANAAGDMKCMVDAGYKVYVNGGTVRDGVLGVAAHDVDFSTNASIDQILATVPNSKKFHAFGNIWVVKAYHEGDIETDIAPMFSIFPEYSGKANVPQAKNPSSPYCDDLLEDTYCRDFTFNSLYYDYATGDIIDYHGGLYDLREGVVRSIIEPDLRVPADTRIILRGLRFAAKYQFLLDDAFEKAIRKHVGRLADLDSYNVIYNTASGFDGGFALRYFKQLESFKVTDVFLTSLSDRLSTDAYKNFVEGMLSAFDASGKADLALCWAAILWPRFADDIKAYSNPTATDVKTVWDAIDAANSANFKFDYEDYTYVPEFIQDVWYLQLQMADPANRTAEKAPSIRNHKRFADALRFLKARAMLDSSIDYVDYWK